MASVPSSGAVPLSSPPGPDAGLQDPVNRLVPPESKINQLRVTAACPATASPAIATCPPTSAGLGTTIQLHRPYRGEPITGFDDLRLC